MTERQKNLINKKLEKVHSELDIVVDWVYWKEHEAENLSLPKSNRLWECMNIIKQIIEEKEEHGK